MKRLKAATINEKKNIDKKMSKKLNHLPKEANSNKKIIINMTMYTSKYPFLWVRKKNT